MTKAILALAATLLAGSALAQSGAQVYASAATDASKPTPPPASATSHESPATDASKPPPASASVNASAATDAARSGAATKASAATDAPQRLIPQARKTRQPAADQAKPAK